MNYSKEGNRARRLLACAVAGFFLYCIGAPLALLAVIYGYPISGSVLLAEAVVSLFVAVFALAKRKQLQDWGKELCKN